MQIEIDSPTIYKRLRTQRDIAKLFFRYLHDVMNLGAHATLVVSHNDKGETLVLYGTTPTKGIMK